jgi:RimJ/RimL family protein N-acetyltransferase
MDSKRVTLKNGMFLTLREAMPEDAEQMIAYLNLVGGESDNLLFGAGEFHMTIEQEKVFLQQAINDTQTLMLVGCIGHEIISISTIMGAKRKRIAHNADLSISVKQAYWGLGVGKAVMAVLINYAKENPTLQVISLGVKKSNVNAIALYEKFGFQTIGIHKRFFNIDGQYDDELLMDLCL